jgi:hypothetical protein
LQENFPESTDIEVDTTKPPIGTVLFLHPPVARSSLFRPRVSDLSGILGLLQQNYLRKFSADITILYEDPLPEELKQKYVFIAKGAHKVRSYH